MGERGLALVSRYGNSNLGIPLYISANVQELYNRDMDRTYDDLVVGALNERRGQYIHTYKPLGEKRPTKRVACLFKSEEGGTEGNPLLVYTPNAHSFVTNDTLVLSCIGAVQGPAGEPIIMGGTDDGFMVWMDRADTQLHLMGETAGLWSSSSSTVASASGRSSVTLAGSATVDTTLENVRGTVMRYVSGSTEYAVRLLGAASKMLLFDEQVLVAPTVSGVVTLGAQVHRWDSGWLDCGNPQQMKNATYLDAIAKVATEGQMRFVTYRDFGGTAINTNDIDLTRVQKQIPLDGLDGRLFQVSVRSVPLTTKAVLSLSSLILRVQDIDQD